MTDSQGKDTFVFLIEKKLKDYKNRLRKKIRSLLGKPSNNHQTGKTNSNNAKPKLDRKKIDKENKRLLKKIKKRIKQRGKANIGFLVNDSTKWNVSNLVQAFTEDPRFDCMLYLTCPGRKDKTSKEHRHAYLKEREWFLSLGLPLTELYDCNSDSVKPITDYEIDVLFFQQPWSLQPILQQVLGHALPVYMPYAYHVYANYKMQYQKNDFLAWLWCYFEQSEWHKKTHLSMDPQAKAQIVVTGYPKLDVYLDNKKPETDIWKGLHIKARVIYAPHHSLKNESLRISTFDWNHNFLFEVAQKHSDISWIYRPHGKLRYVVEKSGVMTKEEYAQYEESWDKLENTRTYLQGTYFDVFKSSDVLITDSSSFLGEYMPTGNPVIWLIAENPNVIPNDVGKKITDTYYQARNLQELEQHFTDVVLNGNDYLKEKRLAVMHELFPKTESASQKVKKHLEKALGMV